MTESNSPDIYRSERELWSLEKDMQDMNDSQEALLRFTLQRGRTVPYGGKLTQVKALRKMSTAAGRRRLPGFRERLTAPWPQGGKSETARAS